MAIVYLYLDPSADARASRNNEATFSAVSAQQARRTGAQRHMFSTGREVLQHLQRYEQIERLVIFAHGGPSAIGWLRGGGIHSTRRAGGWKNVSQLAEVLAPRLAPNTVIGLAACTCGSAPRDWRRAREIESQMNDVSRRIYGSIPSGLRGRELRQARREAAQAAGSSLVGQYRTLHLEFNRLSQFTSNGVGSIAYNMRDAMLNGGATGVEVRAHLWAGAATTNPHCIAFSPPARSPGVALASSFEATRELEDVSWTQMQEFRRYWTGERAQEWILGGPSPENVSLPPATSDIDTETAIAANSVPADLGTDGNASVIPDRRDPNAFEDTESVGQVSDTSNSNVAQGELLTKEQAIQKVTDWSAIVEAQLNRNRA